jgi:hypothetical protein
MPLGGYCTTCQRWVWLNPYGECENGHPAAAVRDMQQLKPAAGRQVARREAAPLQARAQFRWWWRYSLWIPWTFTAGFFNWVAFIYIGVRARHTAWIMSGFAYLVPLLLTIASVGTGYIRYFFAFQVLVSAISLVHGLWVRPTFRALMFGDVPRRALPAPPQPPSLATAQRPELPRSMDGAAGEVILAARAQVDRILEDADTIDKPQVRERIAALCHTADEILAELAAKPRKLDAARSFLTYYLDAAARIVQGYTNLAQREAVSPEIREALTKAEASLGSVQQAFDRQLANVLEDRVLDLETEIELLEKTVDMDGMYTQTGGT